MAKSLMKVKELTGLRKPLSCLELKLKANSSRTLKRPFFARNDLVFACFSWLSLSA
jgi:hypothetical protein